MKRCLTGGVRNTRGRFERVHRPWTLSRFNDGYVDGKGRFRVYMPNHPRASKNGYVLRALVAYEAYHKISIPKRLIVHHMDENPVNDSVENLIMLTNSQHQKIHRGAPVLCLCRGCRKIFKLTKHRLTEKSANRGSFCSYDCYREWRRQ